MTKEELLRWSGRRHDALAEEFLSAFPGLLEQPERVQQIVIWRVIYRWTLEQCGRELGLTRERVRQIEGRFYRSLEEGSL